MKRLTVNDMLLGVDPLVKKRLAQEVGKLDDPGAPSVVEEIEDTIALAQRQRHAGKSLRAAYAIVGTRETDRKADGCVDPHARGRKIEELPSYRFRKDKVTT